MQTIILTGATRGLGSASQKNCEENIGRLVCIYRNESKLQYIFDWGVLDKVFEIEEM